MKKRFLAKDRKEKRRNQETREVEIESKRPILTPRQKAQEPKAEDLLAKVNYSITFFSLGLTIDFRVSSCRSYTR